MLEDADHVDDELEEKEEPRTPTKRAEPAPAVTAATWTERLMASVRRS